MARIQGTTGSAPRARKRRLPSPQGPYSHHQGPSHAPTAPRPTPKPTYHPPAVQPGPFTDAERKKVEHNRHTPAYRHDIKAAYKSQPAKQRRASRHHAAATPKSKRTPEQNVVLRTHGLWKLRHDTTRSSQIFTDAQRQMVASFNHAHAPKLTGLEKYRHDNPDLFVSDVNKLHQLGFKAPGALEKIVTLPGNLIGSGAAIAEATYHDPVGVPLKTAKQAALAVPAIAGGAYELVTHPEKTVKQSVSDYLNRTSETVPEKVARIRKEGAFADAADVATLFAGSGGLGRTLLRSGLVKEGERAGLRVSGGTVLPRRHSAGIVTTVARSAMDKRHAARLERRMAEAEAGGEPLSPLEFQAAKANREAGRVVEVVPSRRRAGRAQARAVAKQRGRAVYANRAEQGRRIAAATKAINKLNKKEKKAFYYATAFGIRTPEQAAKLLPKLRDRIKANRTQTGIQVAGSLKKVDMLPDIAAMLKAPGDYFTQRLAESVESLREDSMRAAREDPSLTANVRERRRFADAATLLGMERGVAPDVEDVVHNLYHGSNKGPNIILNEGLRAGRPIDLEGKPYDEHGVYVTDDPVVAAVYGRHLYGVDPAALRDLVHDSNGGKGARRSSVDIPPEALRYLGRVGEWDDKLTNELKAKHRPTEQVPALRYFDETDPEFAQRVAAEADRHGLAQPLYFRSERYAADGNFADRAVGGSHAMRRDQRHEGKNLAAGLQDTRPEQYTRGLARNIKRKHNWKLVADILDANALKEFTPAQGTKLSTLRARLHAAGVDLNQVAFWDAGAFRAAQRVEHDPTAGEEFASPEEFQQAEIRDALARSTYPADAPADVLKSTRQWVVVPIKVLRELEAETTPSGKIGRTLDIAKGKSSRAILLSGNVPWLSFQVANNAVVTAAATGLRAANPKNWVDAYRWWHNDLTPEQRDRVGAILGMDATGADSHQIKMGAATNSDLVNAYRALKAHPMWHTGIANGRGPSISELNPFELMARADRNQNNIFRTLAGYSLAKREAVKQMGENMGRADKAQLKLTSILAKPPAEQLRALAEDPHVLEQHAEAVADWMGDYTTLTANERKIVNRTVMFYPYLRYSLRLVFWTLPAKHPTATAILAELGEMRVDELKQIFGKDANLFWDVGKIYFGSKGNVTAVDLKRANPALNALWDAAGTRNQSQLIGVLPPYAGWLYNWLSGKNYFTGRDLRIHGHAADYGQHISPADPAQARILANEVISLFYPVRELQDYAINPATMSHDPRLEGAQGDDSLPWSPRPLHFKGTTESSKLKARASKQANRFDQANRSVVRDLVPLIPQPNRDLEANRLQSRITRLDNASSKKKRTRKANYFGGGSSSSSHYFGGSSSSGHYFGGR